MAERINAVKTSFFGKGAIRLLGPELQKMGIRRALLVTDRFLYDSGAAARVGQVLSDAGVEYAVYYNVQPNPTVQVVNDCIAAARTLQVQLLVALGGGSAIDTAKAASIVVACGGTVEQYEGVIDYDFHMKNGMVIPIRKRDKKDIVQKYYQKKSELND